MGNFETKKNFKKFVTSFSKFTKIYTKVITDEIITKKDFDFSSNFNLLDKKLDVYKKLIEITYLLKIKTNLILKISSLN